MYHICRKSNTVFFVSIIFSKVIVHIIFSEQPISLEKKNEFIAGIASKCLDTKAIAQKNCLIIEAYNIYIYLNSIVVRSSETRPRQLIIPDSNIRRAGQQAGIGAKRD